MAQVELKGVTKTFGSNIVIDECNLSIADKEFLVLVGPSGCGKSTLLRIIAGLESATSGQVHIGDREVSDLPPKDRDIAMVFQNYALYPHLTVYKNMGFGLKMRGFKKAEIDERVKSAAEMLKIEHLLDRRPAQLSGGQRQRVAMGRAIVRKPAVFLFDEPLSNLDAKLRAQMRVEIKKLHRMINTTIIYVTHDQVEAMTLADRIAMIDGGKIQQLAPPDEVYNDPTNRTVAEFIGSPKMNFIAVTIEKSDGALIAKAGSFAVPLVGDNSKACEKLVGSKAVAGIRPENLHVKQAPDRIVKFETVVDVIEPLGSSTVLYCKAGYDMLVAVAPPAFDAAQGKTLSLFANPESIRLFDEKTGLNLLEKA